MWGAANLVSRLETGTMDNLVINNKLTTSIVDDKSTDASSAIGEGIADAIPEATLIDNRETLLDITGLCHSDNPSIVTHIQNTVRLVNRPKHALDDD